MSDNKKSNNDFLTVEDLKEMAEALEKGIEQQEEQVEKDEVLESRRTFQRKLITQTLKYAFKEVPYYRELGKRIGLKVDSFQHPKILQKIPPLESELVRKNPGKFVAESSLGKIVTTRRSSGTTSTPIRVYVSRDEIDAITYYTRIMKAHTAANEKPFSLYIGGFSPIMIQTLSDFTIVSQVDYLPGRIFDKIIEDLIYEHKLPNFPRKISCIYVDSMRWIRLLTKAMSKKGISPLSTGVTKIGILDSVSEASKEWIKEIWNAEVECIFSLAECMGGAYQCESGNYHFDICSYLEIVDFENLAPVKVGEEGTLLLTTLHPFQQATPLIRYSTGDLVIRGPDECGCGEAGASFSKVLGRSKYCIYLGRPSKSDSNRKWIGHYEVRDILEKHPEYFIIEGYEAPIIKIMKEEREDSIKIKIEVCINKGVEKAEAEKKAKEGINEILAPWKDQLETGRLKVMINSLEVPAYTDPRSIRFFEQH